MKSLASLFDAIVGVKPLQVHCVLPPPPKVQRAPKAAPVNDIYLENEDTQTYGFNIVTAIRRREGSVPELTQADKSELLERGLWGKENTALGKVTNVNNAKAKALWNEGYDAADIGKALSLSASWAEKRHASFEAALKNEN